MHIHRERVHLPVSPVAKDGRRRFMLQSAPHIGLGRRRRNCGRMAQQQVQWRVGNWPSRLHARRTSGSHAHTPTPCRSRHHLHYPGNTLPPPPRLAGRVCPRLHSTSPHPEQRLQSSVVAQAQRPLLSADDTRPSIMAAPTSRRESSRGEAIVGKRNRTKKTTRPARCADDQAGNASEAPSMHQPPPSDPTNVTPNGRGCPTHPPAQDPSTSAEAESVNTGQRRSRNWTRSEATRGAYEPPTL